MPRLSYARDRVGSPSLASYGPAVYARDPYDGHLCKKRDRDPEGTLQGAELQALNPSQNIFDLLDNDSPDSGVHVAYESMTPAFLVDDGDRVLEPGELIGIFRTAKLGELAYKTRSDGVTWSGDVTFPDQTYQNQNPLQDLLYANNAYGGPQGLGNVVRAGDLIADPPGTLSEEIVVWTAGGKGVVAQWDPVASKLVLKWKSWAQGSLSYDGDYGAQYAAMGLCSIGGPEDPDPQVEVFVTGYVYQDPTDITKVKPGTSMSDRDSRILLFDWDDSSQGLVLLTAFDLQEPGAMGLWVGPALGDHDSSRPIDVIVGMSQTIRIYGFSPDDLSFSLRWESEWLGANPGAFNSLQVIQGHSEGGGLVDYLIAGSDSYVNAFKTNVYPAQ